MALNDPLTCASRSVLVHQRRMTRSEIGSPLTLSRFAADLRATGDRRAA
jgi:hypothetical protein